MAKKRKPSKHSDLPFLTTHRKASGLFGMTGTELKRRVAKGEFPKPHSIIAQTWFYREDVIEHRLRTGEWPGGVAFLEQKPRSPMARTFKPKPAAGPEQTPPASTEREPADSEGVASGPGMAGTDRKEPRAGRRVGDEAPIGAGVVLQATPAPIGNPPLGAGAPMIQEAFAGVAGKLDPVDPGPRDPVRAALERIIDGYANDRTPIGMYRHFDTTDPKTADKAASLLNIAFLHGGDLQDSLDRLVLNGLYEPCHSIAQERLVFRRNLAQAQGEIDDLKGRLAALEAGEGVAS